MTREVISDYEKLLKYIDTYTISDLVSNKYFKSQLVMIHKNYIALLTIMSELDHQNKQGSVSEIALNDDFFNYILESVSDIGNAIFCWINGAYKPSRIMMRSSIENFIRGVGVLEYADILLEKNIYKLFDTAKDLNIFSTPLIRNECYSELHKFYKELCADVHTGGKKHMVHLNALKHFPHYDKKVANSTAEIICTITNNVVAFLCITFKDTYHLMHHRNKENILYCQHSAIKKYINGI